MKSFTKKIKKIKLHKVENSSLLQGMNEEKFVKDSVADQVIRISFLDSTSVLLEDVPIYQCSWSWGKIALLILAIESIKYEIVL